MLSFKILELLNKPYETIACHFPVTNKRVVVFFKEQNKTSKLHMKCKYYWEDAFTFPESERKDFAQRKFFLW